MKSLLATGLSLLCLATSLRAQTNAVVTPVAVTATNTSAKPADAPKPDADATASAPKATKPYPVTAIIVSNTITFPVLLSKAGTPLMTNAVYHRTFGRKVIFDSDLALQSFDIDKLHPSVLAQLDLDTNKVAADQAALDKANQDWAAANQQKNQQFLAAESAALAKNQAAAQAAATANPGSGAGGGTNSAGGAKTHHRKTTPGAPGAPGAPPPP